MDKEQSDYYSGEDYKELLAEQWWQEQEARLEYEWLLNLVEVNQ
jgi:hypothetical protein